MHHRAIRKTHIELNSDEHKQTMNSQDAQPLNEGIHIADMNRLLRFIRRETGIIVKNHQAEKLQATVIKGCQRFRCPSPVDFIEGVINGPADSAMLRYLIGEVTIGESYFFRDIGQMNYLENEYLPQLIDSRKNRTRALRVWSAAASQGQEIYSIAIMLCRLLPDIDDWELNLIGSDIDSDALRRAALGAYGNWSFRNVPSELKKAFFHPKGDTLQLSARVRKLVRFAQLNLICPKSSLIANKIYNMDLVLCRNVFIYFDENDTRKILKRIVGALAPGGVLMLGPSDLINPEIDGLEIHSGENFFYYVKTSKPRPTAQPPAEHSARRPTPARDIINSVHLPATQQSNPATPPDSGDTGQIRQTMLDLVKNENWGKTIELAKKNQITVNHSADLLFYQARAEANLGRTQNAMERCTQSLALDNTYAPAHLLHALLLCENGAAQEAKNALQRTLFLAPDLIEAHYQLGVILIAEGNLKRGVKSLKNALSLAKNRDTGAPDDLQLIAALEQEIALYGNSL